MKIPKKTKYPGIYKALRMRDTRIRPIGWVSGQNRFIGSYEMNYCYKITGHVPFVQQIGSFRTKVSMKHYRCIWGKVK